MTNSEPQNMKNLIANKALETLVAVTLQAAICGPGEVSGALFFERGK